MNDTFSPTFERREARAVEISSGRFRRAAAWLLLCLERRRQRRHLAELDQWLLDDIGLTRREVVQEATKRWWR